MSNKSNKIKFMKTTGTPIIVKSLDITLKCPQTSTLFHPKKIGQLYLNREAGWTFRNRLNSSNDDEYKARQKSNLLNLKILIGMAVQKRTSCKIGYVESLGFDWAVAKSIPSPFNGGGEWFEVFGFYIRKGIKSHMILTPDYARLF